MKHKRHKKVPRFALCQPSYRPPLHKNYETTLSLDTQQEGIKSGMTADIVVETNKKENVLMIPINVIEKIDGLERVQVKNGKQIEDRIIQTGLEGNDYAEVISGLNEGEEIITGKK